ncbi:hypothetical protein LF41_2287 [Lysobacter dokdonensis DS-58]|uniref:STAS/SEC14 domain-containing protein n=1 Tax=Lysobacter dokdonensis DS-58 TaxID=1300345 RepID=A0A0A2WNC3_9GAMM|nr:hypothetical protein [Lysobacter dokdonensis]KGQ19785.1 hypothetical protein LF41_2287 [Lysobacter dokdonensis DS-58]
MTIQFRLSDDARLFEVRYVGPLDYAMRTRAVEAAQRRLKDGWVKQILIDFSDAWPVEPADPEQVEQFRKTLARATYPRGARIAFLNPPGEYDDDAIQVGRVSAHFVGRRFRDRRHALAWLRGRL